MTITVTKETHIPPAVLRAAGIQTGDQLEVKVSGGIITMFPTSGAAGDDYTPEQRRMIDAELDAAENGPFYGPFHSADEMIADMKSRL